MYILRAHACFYFAFYAWRMALRREDLGRWYNTVDFAKQWTVRVVLALACFFLNIVWRIPMRAVVGESMIFCALRYTYYAHVKVSTSSVLLQLHSRHKGPGGAADCGVLTDPTEPYR